MLGNWAGLESPAGGSSNLKRKRKEGKRGRDKEELKPTAGGKKRRGRRVEKRRESGFQTDKG